MCLNTIIPAKGAVTLAKTLSENKSCHMIFMKWALYNTVSFINLKLIQYDNKRHIVFYNMTKYTLIYQIPTLQFITFDKWRVHSYRTDSNGIEQLWASNNVFNMYSVSLYIYWQQLPVHFSQKFKCWDSFMSEPFILYLLSQKYVLIDQINTGHLL